MMSSRLKWLVVIQLLLNEQALCRAPPPLAQRSALPPGGVEEEMPKEERQPFLGSQLQTDPVVQKEEEDRIQSAERVISELRAKFDVPALREHLHNQGNVSCEELLSASTMDDPLTSMFPQELLGLSLVPVLVAAGCPQEAHTLVLKLYDLLGAADTDELLMEVQSLIERRMSKKSASTPASSQSTDRHMEAVMFNIQQLGVMGEESTSSSSSSKPEGRCAGWTRVNGTTLVGSAVEGTTDSLEEAVSSCERLGVQCAGVTSTGLHQVYQAVLKRGSRVLPSDSSGSECWIRQCSIQEEEVEEEEASSGRARMKRSAPRSCINKREERVYNVVEWIPAVSTLYNLGTAVYYASLNCSETAKERAILSAVDLGTDALMVATGGTAGVAGYALGAGVKTGVKAGVRYLLNSMKQEDDDVLVNQFSWEEGVITIQ